MAIITISRGSYCKGKEVAEMVAQRLGYRCLSREVILDASEYSNISEIKLIKAIHDAPSILDRFGRSKRSFIAYYQRALSLSVQNDNVVYHGLAGHLLLTGIPHVLKVRITADLDHRVALEMKRDGIPMKEARRLILKDDQERRKWTQSLYGVDPWDSSLYDLTIHVQRFAVNDAVDFICRSANLEPFKTTSKSQKILDDLALSTQVKVALIDAFPHIFVKSDHGNVLIYVKSDMRQSRKLQVAAKRLIDKIPGIYSMEVHPGGGTPPGAV